MRRELPRWILLLSLLTLLLLLLPGCGKSGTDSGDSDATATDADGRVEIVFWHSYVSYTNPAIKRMVERFEKEHPNIKLRTQYVQTGDVMLQKLTTALMTNTVPDCCWVRTNWIPELADQDAIFNVDELAEKYGGFTKEDEEDFFPSLISTSYYKGKLRGLPIQATCMTLGYNEELVKKAGLDPNKPPEDWDEFVEYAKKLVVHEGDKTPQWAFHIPVFTGQLANYGVWQWNIFLWGWGGRYADPSGEKVAFNSDAGVGALQYWKDLRDTYKIGDLTVPTLGFESQKVAMMLLGCWDIPHLMELDFKCGLWPMPAGPEKRVFPVDGEYLVVFRQAKHPEEAWEFAKWFSSPEVQEQWSADAKYLPVRKSTLASPSYQEYLKTDPLLKAFADQMEYAHSEVIPFRSGTAIDLLLASAIEEGVRGVGGITPKQALDNAAEKANELLAEQREKAAAAGGAR